MSGIKTAILLAAFGAGNPYGRAGLAGFESLCRARFGSVPVRWAFTSPVLRERLARARQKSDSVLKAVLRFHFEKYDSVAIQPLQIIPGHEYGDVLAAVEEAVNQTGINCAVGSPLLTEDTGEAAARLIAHIPLERRHDEDVVFMGHGASHPANCMYDALAKETAARDRRVFIATMSGRLDDILPALTSARVWLLPLLSAVGQHTLRDMAGPGHESWKSRIELAGHECRAVLKGLIESPQLAQLWLDRLADALSGLRPGFS